MVPHGGEKGKEAIGVAMDALNPSSWWAEAGEVL